MSAGMGVYWGDLDIDHDSYGLTQPAKDRDVARMSAGFKELQLAKSRAKEQAENAVFHATEPGERIGADHG